MKREEVQISEPKIQNNQHFNIGVNTDLNFNQNNDKIRPLSFYYKQKKKYVNKHQLCGQIQRQKQKIKQTEQLQQQQFLIQQKSLESTDPFLQLATKYQIKRIFGRTQLQLQQLKNIHLVDKSVQNNQLQLLFAKLNKIQSVILNNCYKISSFSNRMFQTLSNLKKLQLIDLPIKQSIQINQLNNLETLSILYCPQFLIQLIRISNCKNLRKFTCNFTSVKVISIQNLPQLEQFDVSQINFNQGNYTNLKNLSFSSSKIIQINLQEILESSLSLQTLDLSFCLYFRKIQLSHFSNLRIIDLQHSKVKAIEISDLSSLQILTLWICSSVTNVRVKRCPKLQTFSLYKIQHANYIQLEQLDSLKVFYLQYCHNLHDLKIIKCKSLPKICLGKQHNGLSIVKIYLHQLAALQKLSLYLSSQESIVSVSNCQKLKTIFLYSIKSIAHIKFQRLTGLQQLNLACNIQKIRNLQVFESFNIKSLDLERSKFDIKQVFSLIKNLSKLENLNLSYCQFLLQQKLDLSQQIKQLRLNIMNSQRILKDICQNKLSKIVFLDLSQNKIDNLQPITLINLQNMENLNLNDNLICNCKPLKKTTKLSKCLRLQRNRMSIYDFQRGMNEVMAIYGFSSKSLNNTISITKMFKLKCIQLSSTMFTTYHSQQKKQLIRKMFQKRFIPNYLAYLAR